jgi:hypothetical protein
MVLIVPWDLHQGDDWRLKLNVTDRLYVVGYPVLRVGVPFPIWLQGTVASEPAVPYANLPLLLIDSRTRPGASGSPVIRFVLPGEMVRTEDDLVMVTEPLGILIGVYSGRLDERMDVGLVWRKGVIADITDAGHRGDDAAPRERLKL